MRILTYVFETSLSFSCPVTDHSFVLRCLPKSANTQTVMDAQIFTSPRASLAEQEDGFGNRIIVGYLPQEHGSFNFYTTGHVMVACDLAGETPCHPMFVQPTRLTGATAEMATFAREVVGAVGGCALAQGTGEGGNLPRCAGGGGVLAQVPGAMRGGARAVFLRARRHIHGYHGRRGLRLRNRGVPRLCSRDDFAVPQPGNSGPLCDGVDGGPRCHSRMGGGTRRPPLVRL